MESPPTKEAGKQLVRIQVTDFWQTKLRNDVSALPSLQYFKPQYMSLSRPHPLFQTCGQNSYEICKAVVQAKMLSGRYRSDSLARHFNQGSDGNCTLCVEDVPGTIKHILVHCSTLSATRVHLLNKLKDYKISDISKSIINTIINSGNSEDLVQFLLDCSANPDVISATQLFGQELQEELFRFARSWCYTIHKTKLKLQGRWRK